MNRTLRIFWLVISYALITTPVAATTYYVALEGDDSNSGTESLPWRTIAQGVATLQAGDTLIVHDGNYDERVTTIRGGNADTNRIVFKAEGDVVMRGFAVQHPYITIDGFDITGHSSSDVYDAHIEVESDGDHLIFINNTIRDGIFLVDSGMMFYDNGAEPDTITCSSGDFLAAGFRSGQTIRVLNGTNNMNLENRGTHVIASVEADTLAVTGSLVNEGPATVYITGSYVYGLILRPGTENCILRGNRFQNLSFDFLFIAGDRHLIENNTMEACHGWDVIHMMGADHVFRGNLIHNSPLVVYQVSPDVFENWPTKYKNVLFEGNFIQDIAGVMGSQKQGNTDSADLTFRRNVFINVGRFTTIFTNTVFENNTFLNVAANANPVVSMASHAIRYAGVNAVNPVIKNNIFVGCGEGRNPADQGWYEIDVPYSAADVTHNFVAGAAPEFGAKAGFVEGLPGLNGGDPGFVNIYDPLGADGLPFTADDGLRLRADSKLRGAGEGGVDMGAYASSDAVVLAIDQEGDQIRITWPASSALTLTTALEIDGEWSEVASPVLVEGESKLVLLNASEDVRFFRLAE